MLLLNSLGVYYVAVEFSGHHLMFCGQFNDFYTLCFRPEHSGPDRNVELKIKKKLEIELFLRVSVLILKSLEFLAEKKT